MLVARMIERIRGFLIMAVRVSALVPKLPAMVRAYDDAVTYSEVTGEGFYGVMTDQEPFTVLDSGFFISGRQAERLFGKAKYQLVCESQGWRRINDCTLFSNLSGDLSGYICHVQWQIFDRHTPARGRDQKYKTWKECYLALLDAGQI